jgi:hypothetical protein
MTAIEGTLSRNANGRWEVCDRELTSGDRVELFIEGHWIKGAIEFWKDDYYWFSQCDGILVVPSFGLRVRVSLGRSFNF